MDNDDKVISNLRMGKYITAATNFLAAIVFFLGYQYLNNIIFLIVSIILVVTSVVIIFYFSNLEQKYLSNRNKINKQE